MAIHKTISSDGDHLLLERGNKASSFLIVNKATSGNPCKIILFIYDPDSPNPTYNKLRLTLPTETTVLIDERSVTSYNARQFQFKINATVDGGTSSLDITIT